MDSLDREALQLMKELLKLQSDSMDVIKELLRLLESRVDRLEYWSKEVDHELQNLP